MSFDDTGKSFRKFVINTHINHNAVENVADSQRKLFSQIEKYIDDLPIKDDLVDYKTLRCHYIK